MFSSKLVDWIQVVTSISVLTGIGLVVWELQQTRELTRVQMGQASMSDNTQDFSSQYGEGAARAISRACFSPNELTEEDAVILDMIFHVRLLKGMRLKMQSDIAGFDSPWEQVTNFSISYIKGFQYGAEWLSKSVTADPIFNEYVHDNFDLIIPAPCADRLAVFLGDQSDN